MVNQSPVITKQVETSIEKKTSWIKEENKEWKKKMDSGSFIPESASLLFHLTQLSKLGKLCVFLDGRYYLFIKGSWKEEMWLKMETYT